MAEPNWRSLIGYRTFEELVLEGFEHLAALGSAITNANAGGVVRTAIEVASKGVANLQDTLLGVVKQGFAPYATREWLSAHAEGMGAPRQDALATRGRVLFAKASAAGNVVVQAGKIVATPPNSVGAVYRFRVRADDVVPDGELSKYIEVEALSPGAGWNVSTGAITVLESPISGITSVVNDEDDWITREGTNDETDEEVHERLPLLWAGLSRGATKAAYESWAQEITGVVSVSVLDDWPRGAGTVDIVIQGPEGMPSEALLAAVQANIDAKKPVTDDTLVRAPGVVEISLVATLYCHPDTPDLDEAAAEAEERWRAQLEPDTTWNAHTDATRRVALLGAGRDYFVMQAGKVLLGTEWVENAKLWDPIAGEPTPASDVPVLADALGTVGTVTITAVRLESL